MNEKQKPPYADLNSVRGIPNKKLKKRAPKKLSLATLQKFAAQNSYLETWYSSKTIPQMAKEMKISESTVKYKMRKIGLKKSKRWDEKELDYLKNNYSKKSGKQIAEHLGRNKYSVYQKANKLNLISGKRVKKSYDEEKMYIRTWYPVKTRVRLAKDLKTSVSFVSARIREMELVKVRKWNKADLDFLNKNYKTMKFKEIAEHLGRKVHAVEKMANRLQLIKRPEAVRKK
jgi:Mn-dependent DtxR family transcriptional regulator